MKCAHTKCQQAIKRKRRKIIKRTRSKRNNINTKPKNTMCTLLTLLTISSRILFTFFILAHWALSIFVCIVYEYKFWNDIRYSFSVVWFQCRSRILFTNTNAHHSFFCCFFSFINFGWAILVLDLAQYVRRFLSLNI